MGYLHFATNLQNEHKSLNAMAVGYLGLLTTIPIVPEYNLTSLN